MAYCTKIYKHVGYCSQLWSVFNVGEIQKLGVAYNYSFRRLFEMPARCSAGEICVCNNVPTFDMLIRRSVDIGLGL